jgi:hypothetical protein
MLRELLVVLKNGLESRSKFHTTLVRARVHTRRVCAQVADMDTAGRCSEFCFDDQSTYAIVPISTPGLPLYDIVIKVVIVNVISHVTSPMSMSCP